MRFFRSIFFVFVLLSAPFLFSCKSNSSLRADLISEANYRAEDGSVVDAKFYSLSDKSLYFAKLHVNGESLTLIRAVSASGERYVSASGRAEFLVKEGDASVEYAGLDGSSKIVRMTKIDSE